MSEVLHWLACRCLKVDSILKISAKVYFESILFNRFDTDRGIKSCYSKMCQRRASRACEYC